MPYTEYNYENAVIELFERLGYTHVYAPNVARDYSDVLYEDVLLASLRRVNASLPESAISEAVYKLKNFESGSYLQKNRVFMDYLQNGVSVNYYDDGEQKGALVKLADFAAPDNNSFIVANQWTITENCEKRPDILIFLNGIPVVDIELKSPSREETDASEAYRQLRNY
jgi:type I restriction enzyme R subunit